MKPFTVAVIMKDEEKHIGNFLEAIEKHFNGCEYDVLINDTGSSDKSVEIAIAHGAKVIHSDWCDDFSFSRNLAAESATYDTIIVLDCDEYVTSFDVKKALPPSPEYIGRLNILNHFIGSENDDTYTTVLPRIYDRRFSKFAGAIHEQLVTKNKNAPKYYSAALSVEHFGYYGTPEELSEKTAKYERLLLKEYKKNPNDPYICFQLGQNYNMMRDSARAVEYYEKGMALNPNPSLEYVKMMITSLGYNLIRMEKEEEAIKLEVWLDYLKNDSDYLCMLGLAFLRSGKLMEAMQIFLSALSGEKSKTEGTSTYIPLYNMGLINEILGNTEGAMALYQKCGDYSPAIEKIKKLS